jgi:hypothetical protein
MVLSESQCPHCRCMVSWLLRLQFLAQTGSAAWLAVICACVHPQVIIPAALFCRPQSLPNTHPDVLPPAVYSLSPPPLPPPPPHTQVRLRVSPLSKAVAEGRDAKSKAAAKQWDSDTEDEGETCRVGMGGGGERSGGCWGRQGEEGEGRKWRGAAVGRTAERVQCTGVRDTRRMP